MKNRNRRSFIKRFTAALGTLSITSVSQRAQAEVLEDTWQQFQTLSTEEAVKDEKLWRQIKLAYTLNPNFLYLNSAGLCPQPRVVQEAVETYNKIANNGPTYYVNRVLNQDIEFVRQKLAILAGCKPEEISLQANTIMALYHIIFGLDWKAGDEVILTRQDYSSVKIAYEQLAQRSGVKLVWLDLDLPSDDENAMVQKFTQAITPRTKLIHITHMINWTGQILPVKKICDIARQKNIVTLVDGAQTFGHLDFKIPELGCDFYASSLHKWLCAPFGTGLLYARKSKMPLVYPLYGSPNPQGDDITKFEHIGTVMKAPQFAISHAIDFHLSIGSKLKERRLHYLKNYCIEALQGIPGVKINTATGLQYSCGIAHFGVDGFKSMKFNTVLHRKYRIHTLAVDLGKVKGIRVSPNVFTTTQDLDRFITAVEKIVRSK
ncbi:MAG TPA: aminotransferase [Microscillaceae bacterium]|nr:aminotransferase [Microscillaceae bacterium]